MLSVLISLFRTARLSMRSRTALQLEIEALDRAEDAASRRTPRGHSTNRVYTITATSTDLAGNQDTMIFNVHRAAR
jgi:hypothetical protein